MAEYKFVTIWKLDAPIERVFEAIRDTQNWPQWWKNIERVEFLKQGDSYGIGETNRFTFRTELPYKLTFDLQVTRNEPPTRIEGNATGELEGLGRWTLAREGDLTVVNYLWHVRPTQWWMNLLAPIASPFFVWNHDAVMKNGGAALARLLNANLVHHENFQLDPRASVAPTQPNGNLSAK